MCSEKNKRKKNNPAASGAVTKLIFHKNPKNAEKTDLESKIHVEGSNFVFIQNKFHQAS
jgi:hypothetical protein